MKPIIHARTMVFKSVGWGRGGGGGKLSQRWGAVPRGKGVGTLYERAGHAYIVICTTNKGSTV